MACCQQCAAVATCTGLGILAPQHTQATPGPSKQARRRTSCHRGSEPANLAGEKQPSEVVYALGLPSGLLQSALHADARNKRLAAHTSWEETIGWNSSIVADAFGGAQKLNLCRAVIEQTGIPQVANDAVRSLSAISLRH